MDWSPCPQQTATEERTCARPEDSGGRPVGGGVLVQQWPQLGAAHLYGLDGGRLQPDRAVHGPSRADPHPAGGTTKNNLVSSGDPAVAVGPIYAGGRFSWANGSRVYYANLVEAFTPSGGSASPTPEFRGYTAAAVSRLDNPTPQRVLAKSSWRPPVLVNTHSGQTAFVDKEQIWADNAASSRFFGRVYLCSVQFRSNGRHNPANFPAPLMVSVSPDGGTTWRSKQITPAGTTGHGPTLWGLSGCTVRTDSNGVVYVFAEKFQNPALVGLPTRGFHVMFKSTDGGAHWTKPQTVRQITDPCFFIDPVYGRCVGYAGARTDLSASPSVDIANGAPTGADATNAIVDAGSDASAGLNNERTRLMWSTIGGASWTGPVAASLPGDRSMYSAPAISPDGSRVYVVYEGLAGRAAGPPCMTGRSGTCAAATLAMTSIRSGSATMCTPPPPVPNGVGGCGPTPATPLSARRCSSTGRPRWLLGSWPFRHLGHWLTTRRPSATPTSGLPPPDSANHRRGGAAASPSPAAGTRFQGERSCGPGSRLSGLLGAKDDLARGGCEDDGRDGGATCAHNDRERVVAEPGGQTVRISFQVKLGDAWWSSWVGDSRRARQADARCPFDEEGQ